MSREPERVCVFIDWCDVVVVLNKLHQNVRLDFIRFKNWLVGDREASLRYYTGDIQTEKRESFYGFLGRAGFEVVRCKHPAVTEDSASAHEAKVRAACHCAMVHDLCAMIHSGEYDTIVLVTGAGEFANVADWVRQYGLKLEVAFFQGHCDDRLKVKANKFRALPVHSIRKKDAASFRASPRSKAFA